ncbi:MAG: hypothetical protein KC731_18580 [Myxococcales bacterium]|nr:hypothetical protein [Myxococcales bacterium]
MSVREWYAARRRTNHVPLPTESQRRLRRNVARGGWALGVTLALLGALALSLPGRASARAVKIVAEAAPSRSATTGGVALPPAPLSAEEDERDAICEVDDDLRPAAIPRADRGYATWQTWSDQVAEDGARGTLRVRNDRRFTAPGFEREGTHPMVPPCDALGASIEWIDPNGRVLSTTRWQPQTDVNPHRFVHGTRHITLYEVVERTKCLASCWCGDRHSFWTVRDGKLRPLEAIEAGHATPVLGVSHGCYEGSEVAHAGTGRANLVVRRSDMVDGSTTTQTVTWDGRWRLATITTPAQW